MRGMATVCLWAALTCGCDDAKPPPAPAETSRAAVTAAASQGPPKRAGRQGKPGAGRQDRSLEVDGKKRRFILHVPKGYDGTKAMPLALFLHGSGGGAKSTASAPGMRAAPDRAGYVAAFLEGGTRKERKKGGFGWNQGTCQAPLPTDDVAYVRAVLSTLQRELSIDPKRIYAAGFSNGCAMAGKLGSVMSDVFAAIVTIGCATGCVIEGKKQHLAPPKHPLSVLTIHGLADRRIPYEGGKLESHAGYDEITLTSAADAMAFWAKQGKCKTPPTEERRGNSRLQRHICEAGVEVAHIAIEGGGHRWPKQLMGKPSARVIFDFFDRNPKR